MMQSLLFKVVSFGLMLNAILLQAAIQDYIYPHSRSFSFSNYGTVGLINMPTARLYEAGTLAISWSDLDPYQRGSIVAYPFNWFEASYQYTDINNAFYSDVQAFSGDQSYKDKSFDAKFLLKAESQYWPAIAIGGRDIAGTGVFSSEYIVTSKQFFNIDATFGIGFGALSANKVSNPLQKLSNRFDARTNAGDGRGGELNSSAFFSGPAGLFGGIEYFIPNFHGVRIKVEYDGTDYSQEGFPDGKESFTFAFEPVRRSNSSLNFGIAYPFSENLHFKLGFIKGNTVNFGFSIQAPLGKKDPLIQKQDPVNEIDYPEIVRKITSKDQSLFYKATLKYLNERGLYLQAANIDDKTLEVVYSQSTYQSYAQSTGRVARVLNSISPIGIKNFKISNTNGGLGMHSVEIYRDQFDKYRKDDLYPLLAKSSQVKKFHYDKSNYEFMPVSNFPATFWKLAPAIRSQIGGPDGFYFGDLRLALHEETLFSKNLSFVSSFSLGIYDNFADLKLASDSVLPHVRTDIVKYLKNSRRFNIQRAQLNYFFSPKHEVYSKISLGYFEEMFGGVGGEILYRPFNKNYAIGAEIWSLKQRDYEMLFKFKDYETISGHLNFFFLEPRSQVQVAVKAGKFLANDSGFNFDFSRRFKSGLQMGVFFSRTDISKIEFGEGSFDKGFYFHIPVQIFFDKYYKGTAGFGLKPTTRDGAVHLIHSHPLWGVTEQASGNTIHRDWDDIYD